ncbi:MAG: SDR family oxidoreductase [Bacteroidota bacterium]|nr:SDR family oxidoreductase [Bacteroidota bacterium]MDP4206053.1 SDR family oxidoreductase [Bacteroidota bacterium]
MKKTALITGSARRLGNAMALHLAGRGWNIAIHYNQSAYAAVKLKSELSEKFPNNSYDIIKANLVDLTEVQRLIPETMEKFGKIDLLINNASVFEPSFLTDTTPDLFQTQMDINFRAPFFLIRDYAHMQNEGLIINLLDTRITRSESNYAAYTLSKKALWELTKMAAFELGPYFRVNAIAPGAILPPDDKDSVYLENMAQRIPMKRPGGVDPVLQSLDYILENDYLTGQILFCDGGEHIGRRDNP